MQKSPLAFEVEAIRPNKSGDRSTNFEPSPGGFNASNATVMQLMRFAFQIQEFQVSGQPSWFNTERFDIAARAPRGVAADKADVWQEMLGTLLVDRFKLTYHVEPREQSVYELIVSRNGHKLKPAPRTDCVPPVAGQCGLEPQLARLSANR